MKIRQLFSKSLPPWAKNTLGGLFVLVFWVWMQFFFSHHFMWMEDSILFRYSLDYLQETLLVPGGVSLYVGNFVMQFFLFPWLGPAVYTLLMLVVFLAFRRLLSRALPSSFATVYSLVLSLAFHLFAIHPGYAIPALLALLWVLGVFFLLTSQNKPRQTWYIVVFYLLSLWVSGAWVFFLALLQALVLWKEKRSRKECLGLCLGLFLCGGLLALWVYLGLHSPLQWIALIYPTHLFNTPLFVPRSAFYFFGLLAWFILVKLVVLLSFSSFSKKKWLPIPGLISCILLLYVSIGKETLAEQTLKLYHLAQNEQWEELDEYCDEAAQNCPSSPYELAWALAHKKIALWRQFKLTESLFEHTRQFIPALFSAPNELAFMTIQSDVCRGLGQGNYSTSFLYNSFPNMGISGYNLPLISENYKKEGFPEMAGVSDALLNESLFHKPQQGKPSPKEKIPSYLVFSQLDMTAFLTFSNDSLHPLAYEYAMALFLVNKNVDSVMTHLDGFKTLGYKHLPKHIEEAILINLQQNSPELLRPEMIFGSVFGGFEIRPQTIAHFFEFNEATKYYQSRNDFDGLMSRYHKTYWAYYLFFNTNQPAL